MSFVDDQIRSLDALLDKFQIKSSTFVSTLETDSSEATIAPAIRESARTIQLKGIVRSLSTTSTSRPLIKRAKLRSLLQQARTTNGFEASDMSHVGDQMDLDWLIAGKATVQTYGILLNTLLDQTIPLSNDIWYWDDVLGSYAGTTLYTLQTSPGRFWQQTKEIYEDARQKYRSNISIRESSQQAQQTLASGWSEFYNLVQDSIKNRTLMHARTRILSPFALCRSEARRKQTNLRRLRETKATGIGLLLDEGLRFTPFDHGSNLHSKGHETPDLSAGDWRNIVARSVSLLESILRNLRPSEESALDFEESVFAAVEGDPEIAATVNAEGGGPSVSASQLTDRLIQILDEHLPSQEQSSQALTANYGRPSRLVRYWIPGTILLISGSTILRILTNRKAEIREWIRGLGSTIIDFWANWVVDPVRKLIGTIRHDEDSELAIMSKDSLKADRASLERMVVDFAVDHPNEMGARYTEAEIGEIRAKVKEGDLTLVLRAYERDLKKPFMGTVRGDLIRALLIQIQKTKVDVEVAIGGIDALLKSQELLFGFVGIAPGVLISFAVFRWLGGFFGSRRGLQTNQSQRETIRLLRNIDRTLSTSTPTESGMLSYKDHGLLLCEVHVLRQRAAAILPGNILREFLEDLDDLMDIRVGIVSQLKVVDRIQWAYGKWLR